MNGTHIELLQHAHECMRDQISLGDAKTAGVLAWDAALVAMLAGVIREGNGTGIQVLLLLCTGACLIASVVFCVRALLPQTPTAGEMNLFSCVDVASRHRREFIDSVIEGGQCADARHKHVIALCAHIHVLSEIATLKFRRVLGAVWFSAASSILLITSLLTVII